MIVKFIFSLCFEFFSIYLMWMRVGWDTLLFEMGGSKKNLWNYTSTHTTSSTTPTRITTMTMAVTTTTITTTTITIKWEWECETIQRKNVDANHADDWVKLQFPHNIYTYIQTQQHTNGQKKAEFLFCMKNYLCLYNNKKQKTVHC